MLSGHFITAEVNYAVPLLLVSVMSILLLLLQKFFWKTLVRFGLALDYPTMMVDEDLPNFFKAIKLSSAKELILENENLQANFGFETTDPDTIEGMSQISMPTKAM